ncbi:MAG: zinc-finger domain-containing protein [Bosea sp. (in: a-proteobacteria)]|uniref:zinc-finger domain-containing protein n=1 Tax=Bosea sp. (in: a-proteobacteria) TaxID=1871050 RepID=UPI003F7B7B06
MAATGIPHFHNDPGVATIHIGAREFMCIGAKPPFDHPHVFLDMGSDAEIICPYCSTLFKYDASLKGGTSNPPECEYHDAAKAA